MMNFLRSDIEVVKERTKKPAIVSGVIMAIVIGIIIYQGNFGSFIRRWEWVQAIGIFFVLGGIWYGRCITVAGAKAPVDDYTGEEYYPGGFNGSLFRCLFSFTIGTIIGTVMFVIDAVRVVMEYIRVFVDEKQSIVMGKVEVNSEDV